MSKQQQSLSPGMYSIAVQHQARVPHDFLAANIHRVNRAYQYGETVEMIVAEIEMLYSIRPMHKPMKTPRELAQKVIRVHDETVAVLKNWVEPEATQ